MSNLKDEILKEMSVGMFAALADETPAPYVTDVDADYSDVDGETPDGETECGNVNRKMSKRRVYVESPEEVPEGFEVQEGQQGGLYYETDEASGDFTQEEWEQAGVQILEDFDEDDYRWEYWESPDAEDLQPGAIVHISDEMFAVPGDTDGPRAVIVDADPEAGEYAVVTEGGEMMLTEDYDSLMGGEAEQGITAVWDAPDQDNIHTGWDESEQREQEQQERQEQIREGERAPHWATEEPLEEIDDSPAPEGGLVAGELYHYNEDIAELEANNEYPGDVPTYEIGHHEYSEIDGVLNSVGNPNDVQEESVQYFDFADDAELSDGWYHVDEGLEQLDEDDSDSLAWTLWNEEEGLVNLEARNVSETVHGTHTPIEQRPSTLPDLEATPDPSGSPDPDDWNIDWETTDEEKSGKVLPMAQKKLLMREWKAAVDDEAAESVSNTVRSIKDATYNTQGQKYDKLIKALMDAPGDPREGEFDDAEAPTEEEVEAMRVMQEASQKFFETHYGDEADVHRALADYSHERILPQIGEILTQGGELSGQEIQLKDNPAGVWTTEEGAANTFTIIGGVDKSLKVSENVEKEEVFNMPDSIYPYEQREEVNSEDSDWEEGEVNTPSHGKTFTADDIMVVNAQETIGTGEHPEAPLSQVTDDPLSVMEDGKAPVISRFLKTLNGLGGEEFYESYVEKLRANDEITNHDDWDVIEEQIESIEYDPNDSVLFSNSKMAKDDGPIVLDVKDESNTNWLNTVREYVHEQEDDDVKEAIARDVLGVLKERRYINDPSEAPDWADVQEGPKGGLYYETTETNDEQSELDDYGDDDAEAERDEVGEIPEFYEADVNQYVESFMESEDIGLQVPENPDHDDLRDAKDDWERSKEVMSELVSEGVDVEDAMEVVTFAANRRDEIRRRRNDRGGGSGNTPNAPEPVEPISEEELEEYDGEIPDNIPDDVEPMFAIADMSDSYRQFRQTVNQNGMMDISNRKVHRFGRALSGDPDYELPDLGNMEDADLSGIADHDPETSRRIQDAQEEGSITMYRAVPDFVDEFGVGDYVALNPEYVQRHGENVLGEQQDEAWHILEEEVPLEDVGWPGEDAEEFVYSPKELRERWPSTKHFYEDVNSDEKSVKGQVLSALTKALEKERRYIDDPNDAPDGVDVQEGPKGGLYYETDGYDGGSEEDDSGGAFGGVDFGTVGEDGILAEEQQAQLREHLAAQHGEDVVDDFYGDYGWLHEWKAHRETEEGVKLGVAYARALGMDETNVKSYDKIDPESVTEAHVAVAEDLHQASKEWFRETFGDSAQMNRGFKDGGSRMLSSLFEDDDETLQLQGNEMDNWAWDMNAPVEWGRKRSEGFGAIVRSNRDIDELAFTIDGIAGEYTTHNDNAVTFDGTAEVAKENVSIEGRGAIKDYDEDGNWDYDWNSFEGSFFPFRSLEEQDDEVIKMMATELEDKVRLMIVDDDAKEGIADMVNRIHDYLHEQDDIEEQVLESITEANEYVNGRWR